MPEFYLTALQNLGNTCFLNSAVQALFASEEFKSYILNRQWDQKLHKSLSELFEKMIACQDEYMSPHEFREVFIKHKPEFDNHNQHDCQEFLSLLIDGIHEERNEAKDRKRPQDLTEAKTAKEAWDQYKLYTDDSFLVSIFVGQMMSTITYKECNHRRDVWEYFWNLSLSLPEHDEHPRVKDCLNKFLADEVMDDSEPMLTCEQCQNKRKTIRSSSIERCPLIMTLNLKRFGNDGRKISKEVSVDPELYVNQMPYTLYACICHKGETSSGGHYDIACRYTSGNWYFFDDSEIKQFANFNEIRSDLSGAYILFYHMKDVTLKP